MTTPADEAEFTELVDANFPRVDLVGKGANGVPRFLIAKQDAAAGLLEPGFVRDLIAKAEPEPSGRERVTMPSGVTLSGSPADIASFIHKAALERAAAADVAKAEQSTATQNDLPDSDFAYIEPGGKKDESGRTTPRSLRHFPVNDAAHVRNALARAPQSPFGDKALPKIRSRARELGIEVSKESGVPDTVAKDASMDPDLDQGMDGMDPTVPLAGPDGPAPGDPACPGSPAWEAIDAATACKWTSILSRAKCAIGLLAEREMIEAVTADPSDAEHACDLQDVCCAIDYAISVLAPFAVAEQAEVDAGVMAAVGKAMAGFDAAPLEAVEGFAAVAKAGRVLSSANEAQIRSAAASLQSVLSSLPMAPPADDPITKEAAVADHQTDPATAAPADPEAVAKAEETPAAPAPETAPPAEAAPVAKADSGAPCVVYDAKGQPMGIVDPAAITAVQGAAPASPAAAMDSEPDGMDGASDTAAAADEPCPPADMTPQPPADAGVPADEDKVAKAEDPAGTITGTTAIRKEELESIIAKAVAAALGSQPPAEDVVKQASVVEELSEQVETLKGRLETVENQPAMPKVFTNGAVPGNGPLPVPGTLRGQDHAPAGGQPVDVAKAAELKSTLYRGTGPEQAAAAQEMQRMADAHLAAIHGTR